MAILTPASLGAQKRVELLCNLCILGRPRRQPRGQNHDRLPRPAFSGAQKRAELLHNPSILGGPQRQAQGQNQKWLPEPCPLGGPKDGGIAMEPLHSWGSPMRGEKITTGYLTPTFSRAKRGWNCYVTPAFLGVHNAKRKDKNRSSYLTPAFRGPKRGRNSYVTPAFWGSPKPRRGTKSEVPTSPLPPGAQNRAELLCNPTLSGVPNAKRKDKIRSGYLTPDFLGAQKRAELLCNPCILGGPQCQARGQNQKKWLPHPYLLEGPKEGGIAM